ncbi:hypothetical protein [Nocardioides sp.]|uniref:hypothetical protein n=1 Tax=Nocardioides sp. TaxID=35761 RepID=UPI003528BFDE
MPVVRPRRLVPTAITWAAGALVLGLAVGAAGPAAADDWSPPTVLDASGSTSAVLTTDGLVVAGWSSQRGGSTKAYASVHENGGWSSPLPLGGAGTQSRPDFARNADGSVTAVWTESHPLRGAARVLTSTYADGDWSVPTEIWQGRDAMSPRIAANATGDQVVAWVGGRPAAARTDARRASGYAVRVMLRPAGGTWGPATRLDDGTRTVRGAFSVGIDDAGRALVAWAQVQDGPDQILARRFDGAAWTPEQRVGPLGTGAGQVVVAPDGRAAAVSVAHTVRGDRARARLMRADGTWTGAVVLDQRAGVVHNADPSVSLSPDGWTAVFTAGPRTIGVREQVDGRWQPSGRLHATHGTASGPRLLVRSGAGDLLAWTEPSADGPSLRTTVRSGNGWTAVDDLGPSDLGTLVADSLDGGAVLTWVSHGRTSAAVSGP